MYIALCDTHNVYRFNLRCVNCIHIYVRTNQVLTCYIVVVVVYNKLIRKLIIKRL